MTASISWSDCPCAVRLSVADQIGERTPAVAADAASSAALVLCDDAPEFLQQRGLPARRVGDGTVLRLGDLPAEQESAP